MTTPSRLACSTTIRLATEPSTVRFPANVLEAANASQAVSCDDTGKAGMIGLNRSTAGTFDTRFDRTADTPVSVQMGSACASQPSTPQPARTWTSKAPTTTNNPANITSSPQSM